MKIPGNIRFNNPTLAAGRCASAGAAPTSVEPTDSFFETQHGQACANVMAAGMMPGVGTVVSGLAARECFQDGQVVPGALFSLSTLTNAVGSAGLVASAISQDPVGGAISCGLLAVSGVQNLFAMAITE